MLIRTATIADLEQIAAVESACFPKAKPLRKKNLPSVSNTTPIIFF